MDFRLKHPDDMTPEERLTRIVEILAGGVRRAISEDQSGQGGGKSDKPLVPAQPEVEKQCPVKPGRVPFGQHEVRGLRAENPSEQAMIEKIKKLHDEGHSGEEIAKLLNEEDRKSKRAGKWSRTAVWRILKQFDV